MFKQILTHDLYKNTHCSWMAKSLHLQALQLGDQVPCNGLNSQSLVRLQSKVKESLMVKALSGGVAMENCQEPNQL